MTFASPIKLLAFLLILSSAYYAQNSTPSNPHFIGELYGGGIVFHTYQEKDGSTHGLILSLNDLQAEVKWGPIDIDVESSENSWDGQANTSAIMMSIRDTNFAAGVCDVYKIQEFEDWYLPSILEMNTLWGNLYDINRVLSETKDAALVNPSLYWSSTESNDKSAWFFSFFDGKPSNYYDKSSLLSVRAIREF
jgi:hypothetical protein